VIADQLLDLAQREGSPTSLWLAHFAQLLARTLSGDPVGAEEHFARMSGFSEAAGFRQVPGMLLAATDQASLLVWILGHTERARQRILRANVFARDSKNPYDLAYALGFESWLYWRLRQPQRAEAAAMQAVALCEEHGFLFLKRMACISLGWARAHLGDTGEGVSLIRKGMAGLAEVGARLFITDTLTAQRLWPSTARSPTLSALLRTRSRRTLRK
jgi:hypothetical protein